MAGRAIIALTSRGHSEAHGGEEWVEILEVTLMAHGSTLIADRAIKGEAHGEKG
jgi:hypothetical protein